MRLCRHCRVRVERRQWKHHGLVWVHVVDKDRNRPDTYRDCRMPMTVAEPMGDPSIGGGQ